MTKGAWVTLATNDSYSLGALVLAHSLKRVDSTYPAVVLITPTVTDAMKERLSSVFAEVVTVDVLDSGDAAHLALLARPELGITFTKIHCWNLVQYEKCVFLDADTLVLQNSDELFEREELSAAPDVGWPDCFNSGVFVFKPSKETFASLLQFAQERGSFDGGDQGLLNSYFSDWAHGNIDRHLPFLYNVTSTAFYSYLPALKQFGENMKIIHFIGNLKPWLQSFNWQTRTVTGPTHLESTLQHWWDIFTSQVHASLDSCMEVKQENQVEIVTENKTFYSPAVDPESDFPWHHKELLKIDDEENEKKKLEQYWSEFHDPWDNYAEPKGSVTDEPKSTNTEVILDTQTNQINTYCEHQQHYHREDDQRQESNDGGGEIDRNYHSETHKDDRSNNICHHNHPNEQSSDYVSNSPNNSDKIYQVYHVEVINERTVITNFFNHKNEQNYRNDNKNNKSELETVTTSKEKPQTVGTAKFDGERKKRVINMAYSGKVSDSKSNVPPRHPYDFFYLKHRPLLDARGHKRCSHETRKPLQTKPEQVIDVKDLRSGLAGTFSKLNTDEGAADEVARRQGWEAGNMDYMGQDSFANIWAKISQTLSQSPSTQNQNEKTNTPSSEKKEQTEPVKSEAIEPKTEQKEASSVPATVAETGSPTLQSETADQKPPVETEPVSPAPQKLAETEVPKLPESQISPVSPEKPVISQEVTESQCPLVKNEAEVEISKNEGSTPQELSEQKEDKSKGPSDSEQKQSEPTKLESNVPLEAKIESVKVELESPVETKDEKEKSNEAQSEPEKVGEIKSEQVKVETADGKDEPVKEPPVDVKSEPAKIETPEAKSEPAKIETPEAKTEPAKIETPEAKTEPAKIEIPEAKIEPAKIETPEIKSEPAKIETPEIKSEQLKKETSEAKSEPPKVETVSQTEPAKLASEKPTVEVKSELEQLKKSEDLDVSSLSPPLVATPVTTPEKSSEDQPIAEDGKASGGKRILRLNLPSPTTDAPRTPDSELEDAATLAQRIIAAEFSSDSGCSQPGTPRAAQVTPPPRIERPRHGSKTPTSPGMSSPIAPPVPPPRKKDKKLKK